MVPPKDPYIKVRVVENIDEGIVLSDKTTNFASHSMHFLKRTDAEPYIARVSLVTHLIQVAYQMDHKKKGLKNIGPSTFHFSAPTGLDGGAYRMKYQ